MYIICSQTLLDADIVETSTTFIRGVFFSQVQHFSRPGIGFSQSVGFPGSRGNPAKAFIYIIRK